ncbi:hypothetical protein H8D64_01250 [PVC group bacterium]|nr:hypothetical protein [PVC group bacterium]
MNLNKSAAFYAICVHEVGHLVMYRLQGVECGCRVFADTCSGVAMEEPETATQSTVEKTFTESYSSRFAKRSLGDLLAQSLVYAAGDVADDLVCNPDVRESTIRGGDKKHIAEISRAAFGENCGRDVERCFERLAAERSRNLLKPLSERMASVATYLQNKPDHCLTAKEFERIYIKTQNDTTTTKG